MLRVALFSVALASVRASVSTDAMREQMEDLFTEIDTDGNLALNEAELTVMFERFGITPMDLSIACACGMPGTTYAQVLTSSDGLITTYGSNGELDQIQLLTMATEKPEMALAIAQATQNIPDPTEVAGDISAAATPSDALVQAAATVAAALTVSGALYPGDRDRMLTYFKDLWGVDESAIRMTFTKLSSRRSRQLSAGGSTEVTATGYFATQEAADAGASAVTENLGDSSSASAALGVTVSSAPTVVSVPAIGTGEMDTGAAMFILLIPVFVVLSIGLSCYFGKPPEGEEKVSCCTTGCCSTYALPVTAKLLIAASIVFLIAAFMLFNQVTVLVTTIRGILAMVIEAATAEGMIGDQLGGAMPANLEEILGQVDQLLGILPIIVVFPGTLASILLLIVGVCGHMKGDSYKCMKCLIFMSFPLIMATFVVSIVFVALSAVVYAPEAQAMIREYYAMLCDSLLPTIAQTVSDMSSLMDQMANLPAGAVSPDQLNQVQTAYDQGVEAVRMITDLCAYARELLAAIEGLLGPAFFMLVCAVNALYNACFTCCTVCCGKPKSTGKVQDGQ